MRQVVGAVEIAADLQFMPAETGGGEPLPGRAVSSGVDADDGATFDVVNPADGERIVAVPDLTQAETKRAVEAAHAAWPAWRSKTAKERAAILRRWHGLIMEHQDDLAALRG